ncbi:hypothetical protein BDV23DRAFT_147770 [Aspergillus alliaceus]|uniref:HMG box domain-containing protein n=1 Tax=Petromyces alliaceus TaxID=209559 RepID=A0A5N7CJG3_PETAA|nr:hypothetical protein BDV23DRAFT_147770 [Aspergillus alliaceus]
MPLTLARRGVGILRSLYLSDAFSHPVRVAIAQSHVRRICLVTRSQSLRPISKPLPSTGVLSQRLIKTYATTTDDNPKKTSKTKTSKAKKGTRETKKSLSTERKRPGKKPLTEKQKEAKKEREHRQLIKDLKEAALKPPQKLPERRWNLTVMHKLPEAMKTHGNQTDAFRAATELAKTISQEERERISALAVANKNANEAAYEEWIKSHSPLEIKEANLARIKLSKLTQKKYRPLRDDRLVKRPLGAFVIFYKERVEPGDFKHMSIRDINAQIREEWRGMTESEKEKYLQLQVADKERYVREYREAYGEEPAFLRSGKDE